MARVEAVGARVASIALAAHAWPTSSSPTGRYTDLYVWGQRSLPLSLEAEIQHRLLPASFKLEAGQFTLAGLARAGRGRRRRHVRLERRTRNARRRTVGLAEQAGIANEALSGYAYDVHFVTGQFVRVDLPTDTARVVNAGHPAPIRIRDGRATRVALDVDSRPQRRPTGCRSSSSRPGTASCSSRTECSNATLRRSTPRRS